MLGQVDSSFYHDEALLYEFANTLSFTTCGKIIYKLPAKHVLLNQIPGESPIDLDANTKVKN